jgi:hypothetical protein
MDAGKQVLLKIHEAFALAGISVHQMTLQPGSRGDFRLEAILTNDRKGQEIEDGKIVKDDYRIRAISQSKAGKTAK